ncbi:MAG: MFS transporter [Devosia sp.]
MSVNGPSNNWLVPFAGLIAATFAVCTAELVISGLLPSIANDLHVDIPTAGQLITGYAIGVGVAGPLLALATAGVSRKTVLISIMAAFVIGNILCALSGSYWMLLASRLLLAGCHGLFFGVAIVLATQLAPPGRQASAVSLVLAGVNAATILGVPLGTAIGNAYGWRAPFWITAVAGVFAAVVLVLLLRNDGAPPRTDRSQFERELRAAVRPKVLLGYATIAFTFVAFFVMVSYLVPLLTNVSSIPLDQVPWVLFAMGLAGFVGNLAGGRISDHYPLVTIIGSLGINIILLVLLAQIVTSSVLTPVLLCLIWFIGFFFPAPVQARILKEVADAPNFTSTIMGSSFQVGIASGAALGGAVLAAGWGYERLPLLSALFMVLSLICTLGLVTWDRLARRALA